MKLQQMRVSTRLALAGIAVVLGLVLVAGTAAYTSKREGLAGHSERIRNLVEVAKGVVANYQRLEAEGKLSHDEAQAQAKEALRAPRYAKDDYYFLYDFEGRALMVAGKPSIEGSVMLGKSDAMGYKLWDRFVELAKDPGAGYVEYWFPRAGSSVPKPKLSYVAAVPEWKWIIGTGVYVDDVDDSFEKAIVGYAIISVAILIAVALLTWLVSRSVILQLGGEPRDAAADMKRIANGDLGVDIRLREGDQSSLMASLKLMQMKLVNLTAAIQENAVTLGSQVERFDRMASSYAESKAENDLEHMREAGHRLGRTAEALKKSIARFRM